LFIRQLPFSWKWTRILPANVINSTTMFSTLIWVRFNQNMRRHWHFLIKKISRAT